MIAVTPPSKKHSVDEAQDPQEGNKKRRVSGDFGSSTEDLKSSKKSAPFNLADMTTRPDEKHTGVFLLGSLVAQFPRTRSHQRRQLHSTSPT